MAGLAGRMDLCECLVDVAGNGPRPGNTQSTTGSLRALSWRVRGC